MKKTAVIFPGQGAQAVGMGKALVDAYPEALDWFARASETLGFDLAKVCFEGPAEELTRSDRAQPAIFVHSVVAYELLKAKTGLTPVAGGGLSSGEWAALYAAGVVSFEDAIRILRVRGEAMQAACEAEKSGMVSIIGLDDEKIAAICEELDIQVANYNSPGQTVVSGKAESVARVPEKAKAAGAKLAVSLPVAGAFHSRIMAPAEKIFADFLNEIEFSEPKFPVMSNVTGGVHENAASIRADMPRQITGSVRWVENVVLMAGLGVEQVVECGPGKVLTGLVKRIDKSFDLHNVSDNATLEQAIASL
ncbi:MAG: ACP S-malonyltransferase [Verrucomicrobia bacterium]|nr:ACP S-malonyltransferase [Verrucomicrobiota bacterium]MCH8510192.1 ACP S-malonyltransferase [Kiritimatiellia bacterium]